MSQPMIWAVDFGAETVTVLAAEPKSSGPVALVGSSQVPAQGIHRGEFTHTGDVTECLVAAIPSAPGPWPGKGRSARRTWSRRLPPPAVSSAILKKAPFIPGLSLS